MHAFLLARQLLIAVAAAVLAVAAATLVVATADKMAVAPHNAASSRYHSPATVALPALLHTPADTRDRLPPLVADSADNTSGADSAGNRSGAGWACHTIANEEA